MSDQGGWRSGGRWDSFGPSRPIAVEGGLVTTRERGAIGESWWSKRFVAVLESFGLGGRMQRGRTYARKGQVISLDVSAGLIVSLVQGSRPKPYEVTVRVGLPTDEQWLELDDAFQSRVGFVAQMLAGEVPSDLENAFDAAGVALFPTSWREVTSVCSCPDHENPCKHIAAVLYLFADRLDTDPWLLLEWRGRTRDQLLAHLSRGNEQGGAAKSAAAVAPWWPLVPGSVDTERNRNVAPDTVVIPSTDVPADPAAVLARLGDLLIDQKDVDIRARLTPIYGAMSGAGPDPVP